MDTAKMPTFLNPVETRTITGQVIDAVSGEGLQLATIEVVNDKGEYLGSGTSAGKDGYFLLYSPLIANNLVRVSYADYKPITVNPDEVPYNNTFALQRNDMLDPVVVTPGKKGNNTMLWLGGGLMLLLLMGTKKRK